MVKKRTFHGDLGLLSPVNLFQMIGHSLLSGWLVVRTTKNATHFVFTKGKLNYGFSRKSRKKIGQIMLDAQLITIDQLNICLKNQKASGKRKKLGAIVVENGYLRHSEITDLFYAQIKDALFETLTWTEGKFTFVDSSPLTHEDIVLEENIDSLLLQGVVHVDNINA